MWTLYLSDLLDFCGIWLIHVHFLRNRVYAAPSLCLRVNCYLA